MTFVGANCGYGILSIYIIILVDIIGSPSMLRHCDFREVVVALTPESDGWRKSPMVAQIAGEQSCYGRRSGIKSVPPSGSCQWKTKMLANFLLIPFSTHDERQDRWCLSLAALTFGGAWSTVGNQIS
jgi:hypothetical protein